MNESVLKSLIRLFALVASVNHEGVVRNNLEVVAEYLQRQFSRELVSKYLELYAQLIREYHIEKRIWDEHNEQDRIETVKKLCAKLSAELEQPQKIFILVFLLDYINKGEEITSFEKEIIQLVGRHLNISEEEQKDIMAFTFDHPEKVNKVNLLIVDSEEKAKNKHVKHLYIEKIEGQISVLHIVSTNTYVLRYMGQEELTINGHEVKANRSYIWALGSVVKNPKFGSVYYTWIAGRFIHETTKSNFVFEAKGIEYFYGTSKHGVRKFNLNEESGRLIGIIGGSGSGKSTLLKLLSGIIKPQKGSIKINGLDIHKKSDELKGVIGYVAQDDFLIKELTVFENLYINARLSFSHYTEEQTVEVVEKALLNFDLVEARDLQVGNALQTYLSGGQRKRLNIALELLREPSILFVDEPTSGLSSADSEKVMNLLKRQTFKGKLVFANIHQPSADIFRLFDKLLVVDQGGRVIYYGNPLDAISYFKRVGQFVDAEESECLTCGNIEVDQILRNVEARVVDVNGRLTRNRKTSPSEWHELYLKKIDPIIQSIRRPHSSDVPKSLYNIPARWQQIKIFFKRDILAKLKNRQYLLITLLEAPVLSVLLTFYTRNSHDAAGRIVDYSFGLNANIPAFLFMSVIVALFLGLVISAEEIFRDRKILERERFLSLSRMSYLSSKVFIMFIISGIQMLLFVLIGNRILATESMTWRYLLIMFSASCWANLIGLNISSGFKSVVTIYILVPLILVPQLLFSGVVVDFRNLNKAIYSPQAVPLIGDMMTSRWAYEAFVVTQFKDNPYNRSIFLQEQEMNYSMYKKAYVIPELSNRLEKLGDGPIWEMLDAEGVNDYTLIKNEAGKMAKETGITLPPSFLKEYTDSLSNNDLAVIRGELEKLWKIYHQNYLNALSNRERTLAAKYADSKDLLLQDKRKFSNNKLESLVKNENELVEFFIIDNQIVRLRNPIFTAPSHTNGRAHFYAPFKTIGNMRIDTFWFNIVVIWLSSIAWFIILYFDILRKLISYFESIRLQRFNKRVLKILRQYDRR